MKIIRFLFAAMLTLSPLAALADSSFEKPTAFLAKQTVSLAKSTLGLAQDSAITTYIYAKLASHPSLSNANLDVSTQEGRVVLNGIVNDENQAQEIKQLAETTAGVKSVDGSKIIVSQQENALYIKTNANPAFTEPQPLTQPEETLSQNAEPQAQPELNPTEDPLLMHTLKPETAKSEPVAIKKSTQTKLLIRNTSKNKKRFAVKTKPQKKMALHPHKKAKPKHLTKKPTKKKILVHHKKTRALSHHQAKVAKKPLAKQTKSKRVVEKMSKPPQVSAKNNKESVDQMTSNFLKTALMANKSIPEE